MPAACGTAIEVPEAHAYAVSDTSGHLPAAAPTHSLCTINPANKLAPDARNADSRSACLRLTAPLLSKVLGLWAPPVSHALALSVEVPGVALSGGPGGLAAPPSDSALRSWVSRESFWTKAIGR